MEVLERTARYSLVSAAAVVTLEERHRIKHRFDRFHEHHQTIDSSETMPTSLLLKHHCARRANQLH